MLDQLIAAAQAGSVQLLWSPWIIGETHRLLTSLWIDLHLKGGRPWDAAAKRLLSRHAHTWQTHVAPYFEVIEDRPPPAPMWTTPPRDEYDWPVWTAAVRGHAHILVTDNLRDGPPLDEHGNRQWQGVHYLPPLDFLTLADIWSDILEAGATQAALTIAEYWAQRLEATGIVPLPPHLEAVILQMEQRVSEAKPPDAPA